MNEWKNNKRIGDCLCFCRDINHISLEIKCFVTRWCNAIGWPVFMKSSCCSELSYLFYTSGPYQLVLHSIHVSTQLSPPSRSLLEHPIWHDSVLDPRYPQLPLCVLRFSCAYFCHRNHTVSLMMGSFFTHPSSWNNSSMRTAIYRTYHCVYRASYMLDICIC